MLIDIGSRYICAKFILGFSKPEPMTRGGSINEYYIYFTHGDSRRVIDSKHKIDDVMNFKPFEEFMTEYKYYLTEERKRVIVEP